MVEVSTVAVEIHAGTLSTDNARELKVQALMV